MKNYKDKVVQLILVLIVGGCASPFSRGLTREADRHLSFPALASEPESYVGKIVILGGEVIDTEPGERNTEVKILEKPLGCDWRPKEEGARGRFIMIADTFLDPAEWKEGRKVTVVGKVVGARNEMVGKKPYRYVLIHALEWRLWKKSPPEVYYLYDPFWDPLYRRPYGHPRPVPDYHRAPRRSVQP